MAARNIFIGTSGWAYKNWGGGFCPKDLKKKDQLKYLATAFNSANVRLRA